MGRREGIALANGEEVNFGIIVQEGNYILNYHTRGKLYLGHKQNSQCYNIHDHKK